MQRFPYAPAKPLPALSYPDSSFLEKYRIDVNRVTNILATRAHYHNFFQLYYVISGSYTDTFNGEKVVCDAGSVSLIMPCTVHAPDTTDSDSQDADIVSLSFFSDFFEAKGVSFSPLSFKASAYGNKLLPTHFRLNEEDKPLADKLLKEISHEYRKKSDMFLTKIFEKINTFFSLCANATDTTISPQRRSVSSSRAKLFYEILEKVKNNPSQKWLIDDIAKLSMMSRSTFTKNFRDVTGMTYHDAVNRIRLMIAANLMQTSQKSIAEIAAEAGFSSNPHFTKECIKMFSLSPAALRREMVKKANLRKDELTQVYNEKAWSYSCSEEILREHFNNSMGRK